LEAQEFGMNNPAAAAAIRRLEGLTAIFLETRIADLEGDHGIVIKAVEIALLADLTGLGPTVRVVISI
jgi:hypothetical protein